MKKVIILILIIIGIVGCKSIQYVPVETIKTVYQNHTDTLLRTDTIQTEKETIIREADSATLTTLGLQLKANERAILILKRELKRQVSKESEHKSDTVIERDTIQVPVPVEKQLTKWQQFKLDFADIALVICVLIIVVISGFFFVKMRR